MESAETKKAISVQSKYKVLNQFNQLRKLQNSTNVLLLKTKEFIMDLQQTGHVKETKIQEINRHYELP